MSIKVMLADDHVLMREGIRQLLEFDGTISVIAEANNGVECMEQLLSVHPDILLLDINMPVMNGIEVLQEIKKKNISVKVLVLTVHNEVEYLLKAVDIGIDGYIINFIDITPRFLPVFAEKFSFEYLRKSHKIPLFSNKLVTDYIRSLTLACTAA